MTRPRLVSENEGEDVTASLVLPFVVCADHGGPYDPASFVAGVWFGRLDAELAQVQDIDGVDALAPSQPVPTPLVPQLDLLAMARGFGLEAAPWGDHSYAWTYVRFVRVTHVEEDAS